MRILMVNKFYYLRGGAERYFFDLTKLLEKQGHRVIPFAMKHSENLESEYSKYFVSEIKTTQGWNIFSNLKTVFRFWWSREAQHKLKELLAAEKIEVAHIHNIYHQLSPSILPVLKKAGIPIVMTVHDYHLVSPNYNMSLNGKTYEKICGSGYWRCLGDRCVSNSWWRSLICVIEMYLHHWIYRKYIDQLIVPSNFVRKKLIKAGFDKRKIKVIPHFIETQKHLNTEALKHSKEEKYILYFGRVSEEKGIQVLLKAMKELPDIDLRIAGEGPGMNHYKSLITKLQLNNVEFLGHKNRDELVKLIQGAYCVVVPSLAPETFGLVALEAMALGKCVIASNIGALPEIVDKEDLIKPGDVPKLAQRIVELTKDPNYVTFKGQKNRERVLIKYGFKAHYKAILEIYKQMAKG